MTIGLKKQLIGMFAVASVFSFAQTSINLGSQAKNVDFSGSVFTKPFKTGPVLPATCSVGEAFFLTTATPGSNIYGCTALNTWTAVSSGSAQAGASVPSAFAVQRVSGTELTVDPGAFRFGAVVTPITEAGNVQILEPVTGTIRAYASPSGHIVIGHNMAEGSVVVNGAGYLVASAVSSYPAQAVPLFECGVQGGVLDQRCVDKRVLIGGNVVEAGASGALVVDCQSGDRCVVDLLGSMVATKTGNNEFLGWNRFSQLLIPSGDTLPASACDESAEHGKVFYLKTAESGKRLYACEGAAGWKLQGTPTDPANLIVKAPSADTAGAQALSSLGGGILKSSSAGVLSAAIAGVDYYRPGTQIPAADLQLTNVATLSANNVFTGTNSFGKLRMPSGDTLTASDCDEATEQGRVFYLNTATSGQKMYACEGAAGWKLQGKSVDPANLIVKAPSADMPGAQALSSLGGGILKSSAAGVVSAAVAGVDYYRPGTQIPASDLQLTNVATLSANNVFTGTNSFGKLRMPSGDTLTASDCDEAAEQGRVFYLNTGSSGQKMYACEGAAGWKLQGKSVDPTNLIVKAPSADVPGAQALSSLGGGILKSSAAGVVSAAVAGVDYYRPGTQIPASDLQLTNVPTLSADNVFTGTNSFGKLHMPSGDTLTAIDCDEAAERGRVFYLNTATSGQKMYACEGAAGWKLQGKSVDPTNLIVKAPSADVPGAQALSSLGGGILKSSAAGVVSAAVPGVDYYNPSTSKLPLGRLDTWDDSVIWDWDEFLSVQQSGNWKLGWYGQGTGTGYLSTTIAGEAAHPGIVRLTSGASSLNDYYSLGLIANSSAAHFAGLTTGSWFSSWQVRFLIRPGTLNNSLIRAGLMNHSGGHSPWPRITARYEHGTDSAWTLEVCSSSTSCATAATAVVPTASTWYNLVLSSPAPGTVQLSVNGGTPVCITSAATGCAQNEVAMPTSALTPVLAIGSTGTAGNRTVDLDRFDIRLEGVQQRY